MPPPRSKEPAKQDRETVMKEAANVLTKNDVMEGIADMIRDLCRSRPYSPTARDW